MHISLTTELESRIKAKVQSGLYNNASEVIREALRFMETHEQLVDQMKLAHLQQQLQVGTTQLDRGEGAVVDSEASLNSLFEQVKV